MSQRKQYMIHKEYQLKTAIFTIIVVTALTAVVILGILSNVILNNNKIKNVVTVQNNIVEFLDKRIATLENTGYKSTLQKVSKNHKTNRKTLGKIIFNNNILLISIFLFTIIQGIILYILMIRRTHRISGPVDLMSRYIQQITKGDYPDMRPLRKTDDLLDFYELFKNMVAAVKHREEQLKSSKHADKSLPEISLDD